MWTRRLAAAAVALVMVAGCAGKEKPGSQKQTAQQHWNDTRAAVMLNLANQQYANGNFDACRKSLDEAAALGPSNVQIRLLSARLSIEQGRLEAAERDLQQARTLDPNNAEADYLSGLIYQRWQRPQLAYEFYVKASEKKPSELAYLLARAEMLVILDRAPEALAILQERMIYFEHSGTIRDAVGQLLVQQGRYREAAAVLRQASILAPDELIIREHLALALFYSKDYRQAELLLSRLLKEEKFSKRSDLLTALGECQWQTGRVREARENFETSAQLDPSSVSAWLNLAKVALHLNDTRRAELSVRKALSLDGQNSEVNLTLGYLRLQQGRLNEALAAFRKASTLDPHDAVSLCMSGYVLEKQGKRSEAVRYYARALKIRPNDELATTLMAQARLDE